MAFFLEASDHRKVLDLLRQVEIDVKRAGTESDHLDLLRGILSGQQYGSANINTSHNEESEDLWLDTDDPGQSERKQEPRAEEDVDSIPVPVRPEMFITLDQLYNLDELFEICGNRFWHFGCVLLRVEDFKPPSLSNDWSVTDCDVLDQKVTAERSKQAGLWRINSTQRSKRNFFGKALEIKSETSDITNKRSRELYAMLERPPMENSLYVIFDSNQETRTSICLPEQELQAGLRLGASEVSYPGIHNPYLYVCATAGAAFALHVEDFYLKSANFLHAGSPKLWIVVHPSNMDKLERKLVETYGITTLCSQCIRHLDIHISPSLLSSWNIQFNYVQQCPGDILLLDTKAYHYGLNSGPNIAEAVNYADPDYESPLRYIDCHEPCPRSGGEYMKGEDLRRSKQSALSQTPKLNKVQRAAKKQRSFKRTDGNQVNYSRLSRKNCTDADPASTSTSGIVLRNRSIATHNVAHSTQAPTQSLGRSTEQTLDETMACEARELGKGTASTGLVQKACQGATNVDKGAQMARRSSDSGATEAKTEEDVPQSITIADGEEDAMAPLDLDLQKPPLSSAIDDVAYIKELLAWAKKQPKLPWVGSDGTNKCQQDLEAFDPTLDSRSWLNHYIIILLLKPLCAKHSANLVDPLMIAKAIEQHSTEPLNLEVDKSDKLIILPVHVIDCHWCLLVVDIHNTILHIFQDDLYAQLTTLVELVKGALDGVWDERQHALFPGQKDSINCAVYTLYHVERMLEGDITIPDATTANHLRRTYLVRLLQPAIEAATLVHSAPRKRISYDAGTTNKAKKVLLSWDHEPSKLANYPQNWKEFATRYGQSVPNIHNILDLVAMVAHPLVFHELYKFVIDRRGQPQIFNWTQMTIGTHINARVTDRKNGFTMVAAAEWIYDRVQFLEAHIQWTLKCQRIRKRRKCADKPVPAVANASGSKAKTLALEQVAKEFMENSQTGDKVCQQSINYVKDLHTTGRTFRDLSKYLGIEHFLLPYGKFKSPYTGNTVMRSKYIDLMHDQKALTIFKEGLNSLRPRLKEYPVSEMHSLFFGSGPLEGNFVLDTLNFDQLPLDCDSIINCTDRIDEKAKSPPPREPLQLRMGEPNR